mmetsp:Transcript_38203/g.89652  ORF Transcript_38203/g.89652 Transcript_38203/m.89652 type:complete len:396 (-) Transcript_38203:399-1586(-)
MVAKELAGALMMSLMGLLDTALIVSNRSLQEQEWPAIRILAMAFGIVSMLLAGSFLLLHIPLLPPLKYGKWVACRGVCGILSLTLELMSIRAGVAAGDLAALTSINTVLSAILGRIFLGEVLGLSHALSLALSIAGAVLISKPGPLSDASSDASTSIQAVGYLLAVASGLTTASLFICSRKSAGASPWHMCLGTTTIGAPALWILTLTPVVDDFTLQPMEEQPGTFAAYVAMLSALSLAAILCISTAAQWCPAVVSATVNTGARMVGGYIAQTALFGTSPDVMTLCGAGLLFASVILVALARVHEREPQETDAAEDASTEAPASAEKCDVMEAAAEVPCDAVDEIDQESFAHFVAAEFVEFSPHHHPLRQRRAAKTVQPGVQMLGAGISAISVSA